MCPVGASLFPSVFPPSVVCHCLLIETGSRLVLVDTGIGLCDIEKPSRLGTTRFTLKPVFDRNETAHAQVRALGYSPSDVTDVIATHLDLDHAGGIQDFPQALVHVSRAELAKAKNPRALFERSRYRPAQLAGGIRWNEFDLSVGESWQGFARVQEIAGLPSELLLVSLPGHTVGHTGVATQSRAISEASHATDESAWLLHAGDSYYHHNEIADETRVPLGLRAFQKIVHTDFATAKRTQSALKTLQQQGLTIFSSHDPLELRRLQRK